MCSLWFIYWARLKVHTSPSLLALWLPLCSQNRSLKHMKFSCLADALIQKALSWLTELSTKLADVFPFWNDNLCRILVLRVHSHVQNPCWIGCNYKTADDLISMMKCAVQLVIGSHADQTFGNWPVLTKSRCFLTVWPAAWPVFL